MKRAAIETSMRRRAVLASFVGTSIEWYDFIIYGIAAALVLGPQFFPNVSETAGLLLAFATFGIGFVARPLGAAIFGHYGDRVGRKVALVISLLLMGMGTFAVGLLPNYHTIGVWAPILLVLLRLIQGIGIGGEWGGAALMAAEFAPANRRGLFVAWPQFGNPSGLLLANSAYFLVRYLVTPAQFATWGWRIPFLASSILVVLGLTIRFSLRETPVFEKIRESGRTEKAPLLSVLRNNPRQLFLVAGAFLLNNAAFYVVTTYTLAYVKGRPGINAATNIGLLAQMLGGVTLGCGVLLFAWLSDRVGRKMIILPLYLIWTVWIWIMFWLIDTGTSGSFIIAITVATFLTSAYGPLGAFMLEQFDTRVRYTGAGVGQQLGAIVGGGLSPVIATQLNAWFGVTGVELYIVAVAAVSAACVMCLRDAAHLNLDTLDQTLRHSDKGVPALVDVEEASRLLNARQRG